VLCSHASLRAAKAFVRQALSNLGYDKDKDEFESFEEQPATTEESTPWTHGDSAVIFAKTATTELVRVSVDIKPNAESLSAAPDDTLIFPRGYRPPSLRRADCVQL
jgi:hypothetical protein